MSHPGKYITTFRVPVSISLDEIQRRQANMALNKHFMGMELIPLEVKCPKALQDASHRVCSTYRKYTTVGVTYDGSIEVIDHD